MEFMNWKFLIVITTILMILSGCATSPQNPQTAPQAPAEGQGAISEEEMTRIATEWITKQQKLNEAKDEAELKEKINELYIPEATAAQNVFKLAKKSLGNKVDVKILRLKPTALGADSFEFKVMYETTFTSPAGQSFTRAEEHLFVLQKVDNVFKYASNR